MNIGLFGGTFDPIHHGHMALARAAQERFALGRIHFVPSNIPPHRPRGPLASYFDRYAMVVLATMGEKTFVPSLLEAPEVIEGLNFSKAQPVAAPSANFSIDTVRRLKQSLKKIDRVFFLIGIDAFAEIAKWREPEALLRECAFIVASRPGYSLADVANALPGKSSAKIRREQALRQATRQGRSGVGRRDGSPAGECASADLGHGDPRSGRRQTSAGQARRLGSRGIHQEDGIV